MTVIGDGGTPSVMPLSVARYAGLPPTRTLSDHEPGRVETTVVHGFVVGVGGWAQPTIGAPIAIGHAHHGSPADRHAPLARHEHDLSRRGSTSPGPAK